MKTVRYIFPVSFHYRDPFHQRLRSILAENDVDYQVVYCDPFGEYIERGDTVDIAWGLKVPLLSMFSGKALYQWALVPALKADLVIVQQENRLLLNYVLQILSRLGLSNVAYFGHGKNWQSSNEDSLSERFKRFWLTKVDWWFAYTAGVVDYVASRGFPRERITCFNNAIDSRQLRSLLAGVSAQDMDRFRAELGIAKTAQIGVFVGGLYPLKRLDFLVDAAARVREDIADFHLVIAGDGVDRAVAQRAAADHSWVHYLGPVFEGDKALVLKSASVFLIPGLVGLAVLDALTAGLPLVTTNLASHSPEIAYLEHGKTGYIVDDPDDVGVYARQVSALLSDPATLDRLSANAARAAEDYSIENMAQRFADGVLRALTSRGPPLATLVKRRRGRLP